MKYKGQEIRDIAYTTKYEEYREEDTNCTDWYPEEIQKIMDDLKEKERELTISGVKFKNLRLSISACDDQYNPNGADQYAYTRIDFCWEEEETPEEREKRIEKEKAYETAVGKPMCFNRGMKAA